MKDVGLFPGIEQICSITFYFITSAAWADSVCFSGRITSNTFETFNNITGAFQANYSSKLYTFDHNRMLPSRAERKLAKTL